MKGDAIACPRCRGCGEIPLPAAMQDAMAVCRLLVKGGRKISARSVWAHYRRPGQDGRPSVGVTAVHNILAKLARAGFIKRVGGKRVRYEVAR